MPRRDARVYVSMVIGLIAAVWGSWFVQQDRPITAWELALFVVLFLVVVVSMTTYIPQHFRDYFRRR